MTSRPRIATTTWPNDRQPVPAVEGYPVVLRERIIELDWDREDAPDEAWAIELPPDLYVRGLADLPLHNDQAVAKFVADYGWFCKPGWQSLPSEFTHEHFGAGNLRPRLAGIDALIAGWIEANRAWQGPDAWRWAEMTPEYRFFLHVEEVRIHAEFLRNAVRVWAALSVEDGSLESALAAWEGDLGLPQVLKEGHTAWESEEHAAAVFLQRTLGAALTEFRVRLELEPWDGRTRGAPNPTTYEALALQIFNDVAAKTPYARCANTKCGRIFPRVSMAAKYRTGTFFGDKYCSRNCTRAQAARDRRRRQAAEKTGTGDPS